MLKFPVSSSHSSEHSVHIELSHLGIRKKKKKFFIAKNFIKGFIMAL